jgi:hypothetical protein
VSSARAKESPQRAISAFDVFRFSVETIVRANPVPLDRHLIGKKESHKSMGSFCRFHFAILAFSLFVLYQESGFCQSTASDTPSPQTPPTPAVSTESSDDGRFGIGVKLSSFGIGGEIAARVMHRANVRAGFGIFSYSDSFTKDGIPYTAQLDLKTVEGHFDIFPWAGKFHVSPGIIGYIGDPITARASIPGGKSFTLGGVRYYSDPAAPVNINGKINFNQAAPMITVGWGNLVPRNHNHFVFSFEAGVAFQGPPKTTLTLMGNVCDASAVNCRSVASDPTVQSHIVSEDRKFNNSLSFLQAYPVISAGFGYKF